MSERLSPVEVAEAQLDRALRLYLDEGDHIAAVTLASAAGAIFGALLESEGRPVPHPDEDPGEIGLALAWNRFFRRKGLVELAADVRTGFRHAEGKSLDVDWDDAARDALERALARHDALSTRLTEPMRRFRGLRLDQRPVRPPDGT